jgi:hypothetical protein
MAVRYNILPLAADQLAWLESHGIQVGEVAQASRFPTLNELQQVVSKVSGFRADFAAPSADEPWHVVLDSLQHPGGGMRSVIAVTPYQGDDVPHGFWFEQGWPPLVLGLALQLAVTTGPLIVLATSDGTPALVEAGRDVATLLKAWEHTAGSYPG